MTAIRLASGFLAAGFLAVGCAGDDGRAGDPADAGVEVDAEPTGLAYPSGPYGEGAGDVIRNLQWVGYVDSDIDADNDPFNEEPRLFSLAEFYKENDPEAKVIMINAAAGWCGPCMTEAANFGPLAAEYWPKGARFVTAIFEDAQGAPADREFVEYWGNNFNLTIPAMVDATFQLGAYFDENAMPMNMFVTAKDMEIQNITVGVPPGGTFESILDYYIDNEP